VSQNQSRIDRTAAQESFE
jgi:hypothetical protein